MAHNNCCKAIVNAAREAARSGEIAPNDFRRVKWFHRLFPRKFHRLAELVEEEATAPDVFGQQRFTANPFEAEDVDWEALMEFLKELMPLILDFIEALLQVLPQEQS